VDVDVLPMEREALLRGQTVLVRDGRIEALGPAAEVAVPFEARRVDGRGRTLLPGLADLHVHLQTPPRLEGYLARGVTTIRNMRGRPEDPALRDRVARGEILGPRVVTCGPHLDGRGPVFAGRLLVQGAAEARTAVRVHREAGYDCVKVYTGLDAEAYAEAVRTAAELGLPVVGHVPVAVGLEGVLRARQRSIEHVEELTRGRDLLLNPARLGALAARVRESGSWVCPTLSTYARFGPQAPVFQEFHAALVRALHAAGVGLLVGSDAEGYEDETRSPIVREIDALVAAGLPAFDVLAAATRDAGRFLGTGAGTVVVGAPADLLLVERNPLDDLGALDRPLAVVVAGRLVELDAAPAEPSERLGARSAP
jgi:imidazolonepropionase-like amidohydrolase